MIAPYREKYLSSNDRHFLAWLRTYHFAGAWFDQASYGLKELGVLPGYHQPALDRLIKEGWLVRVDGRTVRYCLTKQALRALPDARLCGHETCNRFFCPTDDEGNQRYCRPECSKLAYKARRDARESNRTETNPESPMHEHVAARYLLAYKVMEDTCATIEQRQNFMDWLFQHTNDVDTIEQANRVVVSGARNIARKDQVEDLEKLLLKHGFVESPVQIMRIVLDVEVEGHAHADDRPHTYDYQLVGQIREAIEAIAPIPDAPNRKIMSVEWGSYMFNPTDLCPTIK